MRRIRQVGIVALLLAGCRGPFSDDTPWPQEKRAECERLCSAFVPDGVIQVKNGTQRPETLEERAFYLEEETKCLGKCATCAATPKASDRYRMNCAP
jgi:hypothetical protein